jgi:hypothetical protein
VRNCDGLLIRNGTALATHGVGSHSGASVGPASGSQTPAAPEPNVHPIGVRPSWPSASIALAAIVPTAIPFSLSALSGIVARDRS